MPGNVQSTFNIQIDRKQVEWICYHSKLQLDTYLREGVEVDPDDKASIKDLLLKIHNAIKYTQAAAQYELDVLSMLAEKTQPNSPD